jgi:small subunit ribosomal protein S9
MAEQKQAKKEYIMATGRRKESTARIYLRQGSGNISVNKRSLKDYFPRESHRLLIDQPIKLAKLEGKLDILATIRGGGVSGQAIALRHGISRALARMDEGLRTVIKKAKLLTRDPRAKERKKYGRKRARRRFQYSKR